MRVKKSIITDIILLSALSLLFTSNARGDEPTKYIRNSSIRYNRIRIKNAWKKFKEEKKETGKLNIQNIIDKNFLLSNAKSLNYETRGLDSRLKVGSNFKKNQVDLYVGYGDKNRAIKGRFYHDKNKPRASLALLLSEKVVRAGIEGIISKDTKYVQAAVGNSKLKFSAHYNHINGAQGYEITVAPFSHKKSKKDVKIGEASLNSVAGNPSGDVLLKYVCTYKSGRKIGTLLLHFGLLEKLIPGLQANLIHTNSNFQNQSSSQTEGRIEYKTGPVKLSVDLNQDKRNNKFMGSIQYKF
jgi:hypothetical protein